MLEASVLAISATFQGKRHDRIYTWVNKPVFKDASLGIFNALCDQITLWMARADHFHYKVSACPELILAACVTG